MSVSDPMGASHPVGVLEPVGVLLGPVGVSHPVGVSEVELIPVSGTCSAEWNLFLLVELVPLS